METSHSVWVNTMALETLGININTQDPIGGHIYKFPGTGEVDGILMDAAGDFALATALKSTPEIDQLHYDGLVDFGLPLLARNGITSICEGRTYYKENYIEIWKKIQADNKLTCRVNLAPWLYPEDSDEDLISSISMLYDEGDEYLKTKQVKCYSDGIILNATAALHEPYNDNWGLPFENGLNYIDADRMKNLVSNLEVFGYDFHIHAIGDRGVTEALDAIKFARNFNGDLGRRHRITHLEFVKESDYSRFKELNVIADMQVAGWWTQPNSWNENLQFVGPDRVDLFTPLKSLHESEAFVTLSSDWDVASVNPFVGIQNSLTRTPQELPDVETAVRAYTINAAYAMQQEDFSGSIEVGKWADFICVDQDIFEINVQSISNTKVVSTWLGGTEIFNDFDYINNNENGLEDKKELITCVDPDGYFVSIENSNNLINTIELYSLEGRIIATERASGRSKLYLKTNKITPGLYIIRAYFNDKSYTTKKLLIN